MLQGIVEWYNEVKLKVVPCEFDIIRKEMEMIDCKLLVALEYAKWSDYEEVYIKDLYDDLQSLQKRVLQTKVNVDRLLASIKTWAESPMYIRHGGDGLMNPEDFNTFLTTRQKKCLVTKSILNEIMDDNFRLFFNLRLRKHELTRRSQESKRSYLETLDSVRIDVQERSSSISESVHSLDKASQVTSMVTLRPVSQTPLQQESDEIIKTEQQLEIFRPYEQHMDRLILKEMQSALKNSLVYLKDEMDSECGPLFEVNLELQEDHICFIPRMSTSMKDDQGFRHMITSIIENIFSMTKMLPLVAQPPGVTDATFEYFLTRHYERTARMAEFDDIEQIQKDIVGLTDIGIKSARKFSEEFQKYNYLWLTDRKKHLDYFIRFGRGLTLEEMEEVESGTLMLKEKSPTLDDFKDIIEGYNVLYDKVEKIDHFHTIDSWLSVNLKGLKYSLLNLICKWSYTFKEFLRDKVIGDLKELEDFIIDSTQLLQMEPSNEDYALLLQILKTLSLINERERRTDEMFGPLKEIVEVLKNYEVRLDDRVNDQFAELPEKWITLKKLGVFVKTNIAAVQSYQVDLIKKKIQQFDVNSKLYHDNFFKMAVSLS
jgi:dynein heavy chain